jgi:hypothetical protein
MPSFSGVLGWYCYRGSERLYWDLDGDRWSDSGCKRLIRFEMIFLFQVGYIFIVVYM